MTITVKYKCKKCGLDAICKVPARESPDVDVREWVNQTAERIGRDHVLKSMLCSEREVDLMIPLPDESDPNPWIGKQT